MLKIRFSRVGKKGQPSFRLIVAEHKAPIKGKHVEIVGTYHPSQKPKVAMLKKDRIEYWISKGACPTDTVASLLKKEGYANMDRYMEPRNKKKVSKSAEEKKA